MPDLNIQTPTGFTDRVNYSWANAFGLSADIWVKEIRYWRYPTSSLPVNVYFYWTNTSTLEYTLNTPSAGWQDMGGNWWKWDVWNKTGAAVHLTGGRTYKVSCNMESAGAVESKYNAVTTADSPATMANSFIQAGNQPNPTGNNFGSIYYGIDILFETAEPTGPFGGPTSPSSTDPATEADLAAWLQEGNPNLRPDSIVAGNRDKLLAAQETLNDFLGTADPGDWPFTFAGVSKSNIGKYLQAAGLAIEALKVVTDAIKVKTDAPLLPAGAATAASVLALSAQIQNGDQRWLTAPGGIGWTLDDTVPFVGSFVVDAEADHIFVNVTAHGEANRLNVIGGIEFLSFAWWWVPLRAGAISGRYHTSRALAADLYEPGRRLPGALVVVPDDFEGEYELWRYTG